VDRYDVELALTVTEIDDRYATRSARFRTRSGFAREPLPDGIAPGGLIADEETFRVRCAMLDHRTPCLGFAVEEKTHVNVWKNRLEEMGLRVGPWVGELKRAALAGAAKDTPIEVRWQDAAGTHSRTFPLGGLETALEFVPGQRIAYITDVVFHEANVARIVDLARDADTLFIESVFLEADGAHALQKQHLTARQAGTIARLAGARNVVPFHFSPRYAERETEVRAELDAAWHGIV
jgi:ribonuclease Z